MSAAPDQQELVDRAKKLIKGRRFAEAIELFLQALDQDEFNVKLRESLVSAYVLAKEYTLAIEQLERILRIDPGNANARINLGAMYNKTGEYNKAVEILRLAIAKDKKSCHGYYNLGIAQRHLNQLTMAISAYKEAIRIDPKMADAHQNLANVLLESGQTKQAIKHYEEALQINPDFRAAQRGLARAKDQLNENRAAMGTFGRLVDESMMQTSTGPTDRSLTEEERLADRETIYKLTQSIETASSSLVEFLRGDFDKVISKLNRSIAQESVSPGSINQAYEEYQAALMRITNLRRALKRKMLELRAHEEVICTPDIMDSDN